jgi:cell division protein FtsZ
MGIGSARGENRAVEAARSAISSPLLEASIEGAHGVLLSMSGGSDMGLFEISEAAQLVSDAAHQDANIIFGTVIDDALGDEVRVTVIAAGFDGGTPKRVEYASSGRPVPPPMPPRGPAAGPGVHAGPPAPAAADPGAPGASRVPPAQQQPTGRPTVPPPLPQRPPVPPRAGSGPDLDVPDFMR